MRGAPRFVTLLCVTALALGSLATPASAASRDPIVVDGSSEPRTFEAIADTDPLQPLRLFGYGHEDCMRGHGLIGLGEYIVHHEVLVDHARDFGHRTTLAFTWPYDEQSPNHLLLQLWRPPAEEGQPAELIAQGGAEGHGALELQDLPDGRYDLCVANTRNVNQGYTVEVDVELMEFPS